MVQASGVSTPTSNGWIDVSHIVAAGPTHVRARIDILQNGSDEIGLDSFKVVATNPLSVRENKIIEGFSYGPNSVTENLKIIASTIIEKVVVYNLVGQQVLSRAGEANIQTIK